jgi:hypothetical protein
MSKVLILQATDTSALETVEAGHEDVATIEVQGAAAAAIHRSGPVVAELACEVDRFVMFVFRTTFGTSNYYQLHCKIALYFCNAVDMNTAWRASNDQ